MPVNALSLSQKEWDAMLHQLRSQGYKTELGRHLYNDVAVTGLANIQAEGFVGMQLSGRPWAQFSGITLSNLSTAYRMLGCSARMNAPNTGAYSTAPRTDG